MYLLLFRVSGDAHNVDGEVGRELQWCIRDRHSMDQLIERLIKVSSTIAYAHNQGVAHRDIKPANVLTGQFGETLVVDWGLAHTIQDGDGGHVQREFSSPRGDATAATLVFLGYSATEHLCAGWWAISYFDSYSFCAFS